MLAIHIGLFLITLVTTTMAGAEWMFGRSWWFEPSLTFKEFKQGFYFSIPFLAILTAHEFGHYLTARFYGVKVTLPFFIPFPPIPFSIGTMGAVIRIKETIRSKVENFDIGIAGPIAGFMLAILCLYYGFTNLPEKSYIYQVHPDYEVFGENFEDHVYENDTFLLNSDVAKIRDSHAYQEIAA